MSLLLNHPSKLCFRKPVFVRSSPLLSNGFSSFLPQTPPCFVGGIDGAHLGKVKMTYLTGLIHLDTHLEKKVATELVYNDDEIVMVGSSNGWLATLNEDGILHLQDDLNPVASETDPRRIPLPPFVTLPHCQTQIVTNVSMSSSSPEDDNCVVAVKFLGPQISFCRPARSNSEWINIRIANPCFFSSPVMFSKRDEMFRIPGSEGHLIGSWDLCTHKHIPKFQRLRFQNLPRLTKTKRELLDSCCTSQHLVESRSTGEIFLVKWYRKATDSGTVKMKTKALMVFKLDEEGNTVYTEDIGDLAIFLSKSEPFCVHATSFRALFPNHVYIMDVDEFGILKLGDDSIASESVTYMVPYFIPPQHIRELCNGLSSSVLQTPPCAIHLAEPCGAGLGKLSIRNANDYRITKLEKKVPLDLVYGDEMGTIGSSHGWVATLEEDGILRLHDDLNPNASYTEPKRIPLPPLVTLPHCQTRIVTNVSMSSSSPEDEDCVVAVKFLGPQLSFCRPAQSKCEWINIRIENPCFFSSRVMFSKRDETFRILGSGGHVIGSWDLSTHKQPTPKFQRLRFHSFPKLSKTKRDLLDSCCTSEHLVESQSNGGEIYLVKWYKKTAKIFRGTAAMKTIALMVFKVFDGGNVVYTQDIGDLCIFISKSEPFCVPARFFPGMHSNWVDIYDAEEAGRVHLSNPVIRSALFPFRLAAPCHIPPQIQTTSLDSDSE